MGGKSRLLLRGSLSHVLAGCEWSPTCPRVCGRSAQRLPHSALLQVLDCDRESDTGAPSDGEIWIVPKRRGSGGILRFTGVPVLPYPGEPRGQWAGGKWLYYSIPLSSHSCPSRRILLISVLRIHTRSTVNPNRI